MLDTLGGAGLSDMLGKQVEYEGFKLLRLNGRVRAVGD